jgi:DNA repair protein RadC
MPLYDFDISLVAEPTTSLPNTINSAEQAAKLLQPIAKLNKEAFVALFLDGANHLKGQPHLITLGLLDSTQVHPREVFAPAILNRAASMIVAHNHPSGTLAASPEDLAITDRLVRSGKLLGIPLLDHIIMTPDGKHLSMKAEGHM